MTIPSCRRWGFAAALALAASGCAPARTPESVPAEQPPAPQPAAARVEPGAAAAPFTLTERDGSSFDSASLRGKVWVASVFFANCPGPCFRENQAIADLLRAVPAPDFVAVSVTCDPENDTPDALRRYADRFDADPARWKFLTGDMSLITQIANGTFLLPAQVGVHSERGVVFDRQGRMRGSYHLLQPDRVKLMEQLIRELLEEPLDDAVPAAAAPVPGAVER